MARPFVKDTSQISLVGDGDGFNYAAVYTLIICFLRILSQVPLSCVEFTAQIIG